VQEAEALKYIRGARVLLVEDNEINRQVAQEILVGAGLEVSLANDGQEAVNAMNESEYEAVLMDIQMPVMDGYEATAAIRSDPRFRDLPIIAMTAHAMTGDREKCLEAGMNDHVTKPIDPEQLFLTLGKWIRADGEPREAETPEPSISKEEVVEVSAEVSGPVQAGPGEEYLPESLAGFDLNAGLERLQGNRSLYRKLLLDFATNYSGMVGEVREALAAREIDRVHSLVHDLKGVAGNLSATDLLVAAVEMEKLVRKGDQDTAPSPETLDRKLTALEDALARAVESAQTLGPLVEDKSTEPSLEAIASVPAELAKDAAKRIRNAVDMGNVTELKGIAEELKSQSDTFAPLSEKMVQMVEDFDFAGISQLADVLEKEAND
jgi:CheY-like chemotaxis protein